MVSLGDETENIVTCRRKYIKHNENKSAFLFKLERDGQTDQEIHLMNSFCRASCDYTFFSTVLQAFQDDERVKLKGCTQWNSVYDRKDFGFRNQTGDP